MGRKNVYIEIATKSTKTEYFALKIKKITAFFVARTHLPNNGNGVRAVIICITTIHIRNITKYNQNTPAQSAHNRSIANAHTHQNDMCCERTKHILIKSINLF